MSAQLPKPKAAFFDIFGTVVDWEGGITHELEKYAVHMNPLDSSKPTPSVSWRNFAGQWYRYDTDLRKKHDPEDDSTPFPDVDVFYHNSLGPLLAAQNLILPEPYYTELSSVWHRLPAWPDSSAAITALGAIPGVETCMLSNGNASLLRDLNSLNSLGFQHINGADERRAYKPHPLAFKRSAARLQLKPSESLMVAAHLDDLQAAHDAGMRTVYVERGDHQEGGQEQIEKLKGAEWIEGWFEGREGKGDGIWSVVRWLEGQGD